MVSETAEVSIFPGFLDYLRQSPYLDEPAVKAWYLVARMMLHPDDASFFQEMKLLLGEKAACFKRRELQTLFIHAMNYCIDTKINHGREDYYAELFALYRIALDREIIFDNGELNPHHYKNIITISLHIRELAWAEAFISEFTQRLPKADQENALYYNLAHVYYYQRRYDEVIELLREVEYQTTAYALGSRLLLLRTYFELREDQALESLLDSFRIFVRRNRLLSREMKQQYLNMLRFARKLFNAAPFDKKAVLKIGQEIANCKSLTAKKWLTEKAAEMGGFEL
jgi:tetratricopeptide (TPR) repeat protein